MNIYIPELVIAIILGCIGVAIFYVILALIAAAIYWAFGRP